MNIDIPAFGNVQIRHVVFDYNGTIAVNGSLLEGVKDGIRRYSSALAFHVVTADTFGSVERMLDSVECRVQVIKAANQGQQKKKYVEALGASQVMSIGNGANDSEMLKVSRIGISVLQAEGMAVSALLNADLVVNNVLDVFEFFQCPERLIATLRS